MVAGTAEPSVELAEVYKAASEPIRLRILALLAHGELCVCHVHGLLDAPQPTVSRHLAVLRHAGLVAARRDGSWVHYSLTDARRAVARPGARRLARGPRRPRSLLRAARMPVIPLRTRVAAEALGTGLLLATVVGSGIMGDRLDQGNEAVALLANTIATGAGLVALHHRARADLGRPLQPRRVAGGACPGSTRRRRPARVRRRPARRRRARRAARARHVRPAVLQLSVHVRTGVGQWISRGDAPRSG